MTSPTLRLPRSRIACVALAHILLSLPLLVASPLQADDSPTFSDADLEFFEKQVRPLLARRCHKCHSAKGKQQGGLRLDSREAALAGGDTGPAVAPGKPEESLLIDAINYGELYEMPPTGKLPAKEISVLTEWVKRGAPWPAGEQVVAVGEKFDLQSRRQSHWSWRAIDDPAPPEVRRSDWPADPLDRFILAKLEQAGLEPADDARRRTLVRRVYFDLIGLPPSPQVVEEFVNSKDPKAYEQLIDSLLSSQHFGERWARHWLDLTRYAESRGHEFDYNTPNAHEYRDYVIRAFNADLPYDQFAIEHVAGDLLPNPRRHPESGANESILGTGFWFLGEWCHSPVDIRKDEADRFDNMIDVFSKTFLGLTVACARCHDHKFDAISQADYYALSGYLQSSAYRQVRFESLEHNRRIADEANQLREELGALLIGLAVEGVSQSAARLPVYVAAARELANAKLPEAARSPRLLFDFEDGSYEGWIVEGEAFGAAPQEAASIASYQGDVQAQGRFFINSHCARQSTEQRESRCSDQMTGRLTSPEFTLDRDAMTMLVGGGGHAGKTCVNLLVDGQVVRTATGRNNNRMEPIRWDVSAWRNQSAQLEIVDQHQGGWGNIGVDHVQLTDDGETKRRLSPARLAAIKARAEQDGLRLEALTAWTQLLLTARFQGDHPLRPLVKGQEPKAAVSSSLAPPEEATVIADFTEANAALMQDGASFHLTTPGDALVDGEKVVVADYGAARRNPLFRKLKLAAGVDRDSGRLSKWDRAGKTLRTKTFVVEAKPVFALVRGRGLSYGVVDSHRMINGPLHGGLLREFDTKGQLQWIEHNLTRYAGHNAHMEFTAIDEHPLEVLQVVQTEKRPAAPSNSELGLSLESIGSELMRSVDRIRQATAGAHDWRRVSFFLQQPRLLLGEHAAATERLRERLISGYKQLETRVKLESRTAPAMWDGDAVDELLLIRGNNKTPGDPVPRRLLTALGGKADPERKGSGRLELARQMMSPDNPYAARVMVNRIWGQLTGRPIVASPDNFGVLGMEPTHPELLDHLARRFIDDGYSVKRLIRAILLSRTYRMSSSPSPAGRMKDPNNLLLHRMRIRRLQAEPIRDALLAVGGRLDDQMYGRSVPVYLTPFMQGRGRPRGGPLDGNGRRSIYISVRRNFLSPMMLAYDAPQPFSTVGRRTVSNVPAQALILMNDPLVLKMSESWAKRTIAEEDSVEARIDVMYRRAFSRPPREMEQEQATAFLRRQAEAYQLNWPDAKDDSRLWADLAHVLFNVKEFVFIR